MSAGADRPQERPDAASALELRITTGVHTGARIALQAPDDPAASLSVSIGPGLDHDVVLSDAPGSAQLRHEGGLWRWVERDLTAELGSGSGGRWGGLQLTLSPPGAAWGVPSRLLFDRSNPQPASATANAAAPEPAGAAAESVEPGASERSSASTSEETPAASAHGDAQPAQSTPPADADATARAGRRRWVALAAGLALLAVFVGVILSAGGGSKPPAPLVTASTPLATPEQPARRVDLKALQQALEQAGLANRVRASSLADGRVRLTGVVLDDDEIDRMIGSVRKVTSRIVQGVLTQPEFVRRVAELQTEIPQPVRMRAIPVGRLLLIDAEREGIDLPALRDWLARNLPEALEVRAIERARLAEVEAPPPSPEQAQGAPAQASVPAPAAPAIAIFELPALPADEPPFPEVPEIRLVIGGSNPYVVLGSGEKWMPGGRVGGWFLAGVEAQAIILEDIRGRRVSNPR